MTDNYLDYSLFFEFFDAFSPDGFVGIDPGHPLMLRLDNQTKKNNQVFYVADVILLDIQFVSKSVRSIFGIAPEEVHLGYFLTTTLPEDVRRHQLARAKLFSSAQELYIRKGGSRIISTNVRARKPDGSCCSLLYQAYFFYSKLPYESVFLLMAITDISGFKNCVDKRCHFYTGDDRQFFRYPDVELFRSKCIFSDTEFRIIELIDEGLSTKEIAERLYRSHFTINTHRSNILHKSGKATIADVIRDLKAQGML